MPAIGVQTTKHTQIVSKGNTKKKNDLDSMFELEHYANI